MEIKKEIIENINTWAETFECETEREEESGISPPSVDYVSSVADRLKDDKYTIEDLDNAIFYLDCMLGQEGDDLEGNKYHEKVEYLEELKEKSKHL